MNYPAPFAVPRYAILGWGDGTLPSRSRYVGTVLMPALIAAFIFGRQLLGYEPRRTLALAVASDVELILWMGVTILLGWLDLFLIEKRLPNSRWREEFKSLLKIEWATGGKEGCVSTIEDAVAAGTGALIWLLLVAYLPWRHDVARALDGAVYKGDLFVLLFLVLSIFPFKFGMSVQRLIHWSPLARLWFGRWSFNRQIGEYQRILYDAGENYVLVGPPHLERVTEDLRGRKQRNRVFSIWLAAAIGVGLLMLLVAPASVVFLLLFLGTLFVLPSLFWDTLHALGFQHMKGAKVLDPAPIRPGVEDVTSQMAHGKAGPANQDETLAAARGEAKRSSSVHGQEFSDG